MGGGHRAARLLDLHAGDTDIAIRYARTLPADGIAKEFLSDSFWPVCSPELLTSGLKRAPVRLLDYLKSRFVCGGYGEHARVGGLAKQWRKFRQKRWSKLGSQDYESVIGLIRTVVKAQPMWTVEEHWRGNQ
ncbi:DNA-binding transcriptional LysR family regulator [Nitrobacteraceae bacterium AZCC 2161]